MRRIFIPLLLLVVAVSCTTPARTPSSMPLPPVQKPKASLEEFAVSPRARSASLLVDDLLDMRLYAQAQVMAFDKNLETTPQGADIFAIQGYQELMESRELIETREHEIVEAYMESKRANDTMIVSGIRQGLTRVQSDPVKKLLAHDLLIELKTNLGEELDPSEEPLVKSLSEEELAAVSSEPELSERAANFVTEQAYRDLNEKVKKSIQFNGSLPKVREPQAGGVINGRGFRAGNWALTFDDGPGGTTSGVLNNLRSAGYRATFFMLSSKMQGGVGTVRAVKNGGHEIANHSHSHKQLTKQNAAGLAREIVNSTSINAKIAGSRPKYFRAPYGATNAKINAMISQQGMIHVLWNVDSLDWQDRNPASIANRVRRQMASQGGGIILFHDIHPQTVAATKILIKEWKSQGKNMRSVSGAR